MKWCREIWLPIIIDENVSQISSSTSVHNSQLGRKLYNYIWKRVADWLMAFHFLNWAKFLE